MQQGRMKEGFAASPSLSWLHPYREGVMVFCTLSMAALPLLGTTPDLEIRIRLQVVFSYLNSWHIQDRSCRYKFHATAAALSSKHTLIACAERQIL